MWVQIFNNKVLNAPVSDITAKNFIYINVLNIVTQNFIILKTTFSTDQLTKN